MMELVAGVTAVAFMAFVIERLTQYLGGSFGFDGKKWFGVPASVWVALILSGVVAVGADFNFFALFGIEFRWVWVGYLLTALLMSGGSNLWHEVMSARESSKTEAKADAAIAKSEAAIAALKAQTEERLAGNPATGPPANG